MVTGAIRGKNFRAADGASWFVTTLKNDRKVVSAKWMTAGLGVYDIYVNGSIVGEEFLKPGFTHNEKTKYSFTYDITDAFNSASGAENVLAAQVTPGWWADKIVTPRENEGMRGRKCAFRGVLELTFDDGSRRLYGTERECVLTSFAIYPEHHRAFAPFALFLAEHRRQPPYRILHTASEAQKALCRH